MAVYRFSAQVIGRSGGRSATAAAAYRSGISITDERTGLTHDYRRRGGVVHTEILTPKGAPAWTGNRADLWNAVEFIERRKDAQLAREILTCLPHELDEDQRRDLIRDFVQQEFVSRGMIADMAIHAPDREGDHRNHHAHIMLTMRPLADEGFGKKERAWNDKSLLAGWREKWADHQNRALEMAGLDIRVDHRSLEDRGINREPEPKLGAVATDMERSNRKSKAGDDLRAVWLQNAKRELLASQSDMLDYDLAQEQLTGAQAAIQGHDSKSPPSGSFDELFASQSIKLAKQSSHYQQQVDDYAAKLEGRGRVAVFWDKLRGRLGWNAEQEYQTAQIALFEAQERQEALERAQKLQQDRERQEAAHRAKIKLGSGADRDRGKVEPEVPLKQAFGDAAEKAATSAQQKRSEIDRNADLFKEALERKDDRERDID